MPVNVPYASANKELQKVYPVFVYFCVFMFDLYAINVIKYVGLSS